MDIGKWLYQRKPDDQVFLRDEVTELLEAFQRDILAEAWNEIECCDDVRLDQGLAVAIADLQKLRVAAEAKIPMRRGPEREDESHGDGQMDLQP